MKAVYTLRFHLSVVTRLKAFPLSLTLFASSPARGGAFWCALQAYTITPRSGISHGAAIFHIAIAIFHPFEERISPRAEAQLLDDKIHRPLIVQ